MTRRPTLQALGEFGLIDRLTRRVHVDRSVVRGIGDDAAAIIPDADRYLLLSTDMLVDGTHFRWGTHPAYGIGWKALACGVSDIAAMGGTPRHAAVSVGIPPRTPVKPLEQLYRGLQAVAKRFRVNLVGGDTVRAWRLVIDVAILGSVEPKHLVLRSGAAPGDRVFVTGRLGGSYPSGRHLRFEPRLREAHWLVTHHKPSAMMDLSDGLASDLAQLAKHSHVGFLIEEHRLPIAPSAKTAQHALMDGEDFELLLTVPSRGAAALPARIGTTSLTEIGRVMPSGMGVRLHRLDGGVVPIRPEGFRHF